MSYMPSTAMNTMFFPIRAHAAIGVAHIGYVENPEIHGYVNFTQYNLRTVTVSFEIFGLPNGYHGFHVHEEPFLPGSKNCDSCGGHFNGGKPLWSLKNPYGTPHGEHIGDLCLNIYSMNGASSGQFNDNRISLLPGNPNNIVGRSIMVHKFRDDEGHGGTELSLTTGSAGPRLACANIYYLP